MYRNLSIRKLDENTYEQLRLRAAKHGVSMEEEARQILKLAVGAPPRLGDLFVEHFGKNGGVDLSLPIREPHHPTDLQGEAERNDNS